MPSPRHRPCLPQALDGLCSGRNAPRTTGPIVTFGLDDVRELDAVEQRMPDLGQALVEQRHHVGGQGCEYHTYIISASHTPVQVPLGR